MIHIGTSQYYETVAEIIRHYESQKFAVLYEDVDAVDNALRKIVGEPFKVVMDAKKEAFAVLKEHSSLLYQTDAIPIESHWVNSDDVSAVLATMAGEAAGDWSTIIAERKERYDHILKNSRFYREFFQYLEENPFEFANKIRKRHYESITFRNKRLVETICSTVEKQSVITFWGSAHLPGVVDGLKNEGFSALAAS
jgi:phosphoribosyl-ATP pyrophosphohydrolase